MLKEEVVAAIKAGKFHIYPVSTIDEEVLSGGKAGQCLEYRSFELDSVNDRAQKRLTTLSERLRDFTKGEDKNANTGGDNKPHAQYQFLMDLGTITRGARFTLPL